MLVIDCVRCIPGTLGSGMALEPDRLDARRRRARRRSTQRRLFAALACVAIVSLVLVVAGAAGGSHTAGTHTLRIAATAKKVARTVSLSEPLPRHRHAHAHRAAASPGSLPQTHAYPSGKTAQFRSLMVALWDGVVHDSLDRALPAFFPKAAYVRLKAITSAGSDWTDRLVHDYHLDIAAAHALLGRHFANAHLLTVKVISSYGHWIEPGVCANSIGYYELPNARVVYREDGRIRSFGIASMISWRGVWYVVHLGAILRPGNSGEVDEPASGSGASVYSGTC